MRRWGASPPACSTMVEAHDRPRRHDRGHRRGRSTRPPGPAARSARPTSTRRRSTHPFPKHCCTSVNEVVCHGIPDAQPRAARGRHHQRRRDAQVSTGTTATPRGPSSSARWTPEARRLVEDTFEAMRRGIAAVRPGAHVGDIGHAIQTFAEGQGLLRGAPVRRARHRQGLPRPADHLAHGRPGRGRRARARHDLHDRADDQRSATGAATSCADHWTAITDGPVPLRAVRAHRHGHGGRRRRSSPSREGELDLDLGRPYACGRGWQPQSARVPPGSPFATVCCPPLRGPGGPNVRGSARGPAAEDAGAPRGGDPPVCRALPPHARALAEAYAAASERDVGEEGEEVVVAGRVHDGPLLRQAHLLPPAGRLRSLPGGARRADVVGEERPGALRAVRRHGRPRRASRGATGRTKKGEPTVFADEWTFLSKALRPLPEKWHGSPGRRGPPARPGPRPRRRIPGRASASACARASSKTMRRYLDDHGFEEVDTPVLQTKASGALARPFLTHHNALDIELVLRIAPETWLKQCVAGGMDRVYEVARCFRNEGMDPSHLQDFTMVEWYAAYWNYQDNMDFTEGLILHLLDEVLGTRADPVRRRRDRLLAAVAAPGAAGPGRSGTAGIDYAEHADAASLLRRDPRQGDRARARRSRAARARHPDRPALQEGLAAPARASRVRDGAPDRPVAARPQERRGPRRASTATSSSSTAGRS